MEKNCPLGQPLCNKDCEWFDKGRCTVETISETFAKALEVLKKLTKEGSKKK